MSSRRELVFLRGILRGEGRQRECRIRATKVTMQVDELMSSAAVAYADPSIVDSDDFPDGNYELTFDGQKELLTKKSGHYLARQ
jgi:hypothetical protein